MTLPRPLDLALESPADRDFERLRQSAIEVIVSDAGPTWTNHNPSDPGITLLEAIVWGFADLHYRTATRGFGLAPLESGRWAVPGDPEWTALPPGIAPAELAAVARRLAEPATSQANPPTPERSFATATEAIASMAEGASSRSEAIRRATELTVGAGRLSLREATLAVRLVRDPIIRRAGLDGSIAVTEALEAARAPSATAAPAPSDLDPIEARAMDRLRRDERFAPLWDDELRGLLRRERHHELMARIASVRTNILASASAAELAALATAAGLAGDEVTLAASLHPRAPGHEPESWESVAGETRIWPPHPLQVRTCEPVTADDYARRARAVPGVRRAWATTGALAGTGWNGRDRALDAGRPGAITIVVEREPPAPGEDPPTDADTAAFRVSVLRGILARRDERDEVERPFDPMRDDLGPAAPRRMLCDELGIALLRECPISLKATLHVPLGGDRDALEAAARARVRRYFAAGRPESRATPGGAAGNGLDGPWPPAVEPPDGWTPGDGLRHAELVQVLADDPAVVGVSALEIRVGDGDWQSPSGWRDGVPLDADCIPVLPGSQCLRVVLELGEDCARG
jgi:hypothetical protein